MHGRKKPPESPDHGQVRTQKGLEDVSRALFISEFGNDFERPPPHKAKNEILQLQIEQVFPEVIGSKITDSYQRYNTVNFKALLLGALIL